MQAFLQRFDNTLGVLLRDLGKQLVMHHRDQHTAELGVHVSDRPHYAVGTNALHRQVAHLRVAETVFPLPGVLDDAASTDRYPAGTVEATGSPPPSKPADAA